MLDALLATIGTLGILLSLALKFGKAGGAMEGEAGSEADRQDDPADAPAHTPAGRRACPHRRARQRLLKGTGR